MDHLSTILSLTYVCANDAAYGSSIIGIAKFACREVWNLYREVIPHTHSGICGFVDCFKNYQAEEILCPVTNVIFLFLDGKVNNAFFTRRSSYLYLY